MMTTTTLGSLEIEFETLPYSDYLGDSIVTIEADVDTEWASEIGLDTYDYHEELEQNGTLETTDIDQAISIMNLFYEDDKPARVNYGSTHIIWMFHDLAHVVYDTSGGSIYVDAHREEEAIKKSLEMLNQNNIPFPVSIISETTEAFINRFGRTLGLDVAGEAPLLPPEVSLKLLEE